MKEMKKTVFCLALIAAVMAFWVSCSSTHKLIVDKDVPVGQVVTVTFVNSTGDGWFVLTKWNNINIVKELYGNKDVSSNDKTILTVPAGNTSFTFDVYFTVRNIMVSKTVSATHILKNIEMRYELEPEKEYHVKGAAKPLGFLKGYELFVGIYDTDSDTLLKEWKLGEIE